MTVQARALQSWIGTEVLDSSEEKLGKLEDVYFRGDEPVAVSIRSGLAGRKHHAATLRDATVSRDGVHLAGGADALVATDGGVLDAGHLAALGAHDESLRDARLDEIEGWGARSERLKAQAEAHAAADALETQAQARSEDEAAAAARAREADEKAQAARLARREAEARAPQAREEADRAG
jgi:hypothetical protein